jgi:hypothetical protein
MNVPAGVNGGGCGTFAGRPDVLGLGEGELLLGGFWEVLPPGEFRDS